MLSSIHPLGERGRHNHWVITVGAFTIVSTAIGAMVGAALGFVGSVTLSGVGSQWLLVTTALIAMTAAGLDLARVAPPGPERQVNETWIGHYRGWVYGGSFGAELGLGLATFVVTWGVYATLAAEFFSASGASGAIIGAVFGFGRSLALVAAVRVDRPSRLTAFHARMASLGLPVHRASAIGTATVAIIVSFGAVI
jgi:hypothetical protein